MITLTWGTQNMTQINLSLKQKWIHRHREQICVTKGRRGGLDGECGVSRGKLLHLEWIDNKVLLYLAGTYIQSPGINQNETMYIYMFMYIHIYTLTTAIARDAGSILGWEDALEKEMATYSRNPMDRGAWQATVHGITKG